MHNFVGNGLHRSASQEILEGVGSWSTKKSAVETVIPDDETKSSPDTSSTSKTYEPLGQCSEAIKREGSTVTSSPTDWANLKDFLANRSVSEHPWSPSDMVLEAGVQDIASSKPSKERVSKCALVPDQPERCNKDAPWERSKVAVAVA